MKRIDALQGDVVVGSLWFTISDRQLEINMVRVNPRFRRSGVAAIMLYRAVTSHHANIQLARTTAGTKRGRAWMQALGFELVQDLDWDWALFNPVEKLALWLKIKPETRNSLIFKVIDLQKSLHDFQVCAMLWSC